MLDLPMNPTVTPDGSQRTGSRVHLRQQAERFIDGWINGGAEGNWLMVAALTGLLIDVENAAVRLPEKRYGIATPELVAALTGETGPAVQSPVNLTADATDSRGGK